MRKGYRCAGDCFLCSDTPSVGTGGSVNGMELRAYQPEDAAVICGWIRSETELYRWSADRLGQFPLLPETLQQHYAPKIGQDFIPLTMCTEDGIPAGHMFLRYPDPADRSTVRLGFVIAAPAYRADRR